MADHDCLPTAKGGRVAAPQNWSELNGSDVDLLVIGGGINGAGIAFDAALRGADVLLCERRDWASGTSSRSSKLIHGGLRYLEQLEFKLVFESVNERMGLRRLARHLVRPLGFHFPRYEGQHPGVGTVALGLFVYEGLTGWRVDGRYRRLSPPATLSEVPVLRRQGLKGAVHYYDAKAADARLVWELAIAAREAGAGAFAGVDAIAAERRGDRWHVTLREVESGATVTVRASAVIAAVGAWAGVDIARLLGRPGPKIRPTKGIHLVVPTAKLPIGDAVAMTHPRDNRVQFAIPGRGYVYAGTTDTDFEGSLDEPGVTAADVDYMLETLDFHFPEARIGADDVTATWSGLRPLIYEEGKSASEVSREHAIPEIEPGFFSVEGGKLTTYRVVAAQAVDLVSPHMRRGRPGLDLEACRTRREPLPGGRGIRSEADLDEWTARTGEMLGLDAARARHLVETYGSRVQAVLPWVEREPAPLGEQLPQTWGELQYVIEHEDVRDLEDIFLRRTEVYYQAADNGSSLADEVARRLAARRGRDDAWRAETVASWKRRIDEGLAFRGRG